MEVKKIELRIVKDEVSDNVECVRLLDEHKKKIICAWLYKPCADRVALMTGCRMHMVVKELVDFRTQ